MTEKHYESGELLFVYPYGNQSTLEYPAKFLANTIRDKNIEKLLLFLPTILPSFPVPIGGNITIRKITNIFLEAIDKPQNLIIKYYTNENADTEFKAYLKAVELLIKANKEVAAICLPPKIIEYVNASRERTLTNKQNKKSGKRSEKYWNMTKISTLLTDQIMDFKMNSTGAALRAIMWLSFKRTVKGNTTWKPYLYGEIKTLGSLVPVRSTAQTSALKSHV